MAFANSGGEVRGESGSPSPLGARGWGKGALAQNSPSPPTLLRLGEGVGGRGAPTGTQDFLLSSWFCSTQSRNGIGGPFSNWMYRGEPNRFLHIRLSRSSRDLATNVSSTASLRAVTAHSWAGV